MIMKTKAMFRFWGILLALACRLGAGEVELTVSPVVQQTISGWGLTAAEIDWDGGPLLRDGREADLYQQLGISQVRIVLARSLFDDAGESGGLSERFVSTGLLGPIRRIAWRIPYVLSVANAPKVLKKYYGEAALVDGAPNLLATGQESEFVRYIVALVERIRNESLPLPEAVSIAAEPWLEGHWAGCMLAPSQWAAVVRELQAALAAAGFSGLAVIGPETRSLEAAGAFLQALERLTGSGDSGITAISFHSSPVGAKLVQDGAARAFKREEKWNLGVRVQAAAIDDQTLTVATLRALISDLVDNHCTRWFWDLAYARVPDGTSLTVGDTLTPTPLAGVLRLIWTSAPMGSRIHLVNAKFLSGPHPRNFVAVALANGPKTTLILVNDEPEQTLSIAAPGLAGSQTELWSITKSGRAERQGDVAGDARLILLPGSAAIMVSRMLK